jgi:hypothetical protein
MSLDDFIITCFCLIDDALPVITGGKRLRQAGPQPKVSDSEVITIEVVGSYLGLTQDKALYEYFRRHYSHFFPALAQIDRTTFVRQATNLWALKERLWMWVRDEQLRYDPETAIVDSFALPICHFARAKRSRLFRGEAAYGWDHTHKQAFYGFRVHARVALPGVMTRVCLTAGNTAEGEVVLDLTEGTYGLLLGDRNYWLPDLKMVLRGLGIRLQTPFKKASSPLARLYHSRVLTRVRYRIETVFSQFIGRIGVRHVWARDTWHLRNRLLRGMLMHTLCILFNQFEGHDPLQLAALVAA